MTQRNLGQTVSDIPEILYHYTSMDGLLGIVTGKQIWASHVRYLNDRTEQEHIWSLILERIQRRILASSDSQAKHNLKLFEDEAKKGDRVQAYVASFSAEGDLLSQWLSYTPRGIGFAVGFGRRAMEDNCTKQANLCKPGGIPLPLPGKPVRIPGALPSAIMSVFYCSNDETKPEWALPSLVDGLINQLSDTPTLQSDPMFTHVQWATSITFLIVRLLECLFKDSSYSAERECRLLLSGEPTEVNFRPGKSVLIPFVKFDLHKSDEYAIQRVVVGPCPDPDLSALSVKMLFESVGHPEVEVVKSSIPFRSW